VDREGKAIESIGERADYSNPALSPDGKSVAVGIRTESGTRDIWLIDLERRSRTRVTTDGGDDLNPIWSPDGTTLYFASDRSGTRELYRIRPFTAGAEERLVAGVAVNPESVTPDGRTIVFNNNTSSRFNSALYQLPLATATPEPVTLSPSIINSRDSQISPDGRWLAFSSGTLGREDLYVTAFPKPDRLWQLSTAGLAGQPQWRRDGREIFFTDSAGRMMSVSVDGAGPSFVAALPRPLFTRRLTPFGGRNRFLVSPDGQRFLLNADVEDQTVRDYDVIVNWPALLKK
jgi:eukaryotic-like serine/threonine-protein kinase